MKNNFPIQDILKMDGSTKSAHSNAFFIGLFGSKKIVFFDTILDQCSENEILAILCHEIGHFKYWHVYLNLLVTLFLMLGFMGLFQLTVVESWIFEPFGWTHEI
mmetsp:Transcript_95025/g.205183  ORF Transcript_95025/g.205183 Transcript_95025/m.205183 type:complete len:104 (-) Transcript_95025:27-338(-)